MLLKNVYNAKIKNIEDKIPNKITDLVTNASLYAKINEVRAALKVELPSVTNVARTAPPTTVENKTPNVSDLVKKADYDVKVSEMENK